MTDTLGPYSFIADSFQLAESGQSVQLRQMKQSDLETVCEMEKRCFRLPWSKKSFEAELEANYSQGFILESEGRLTGYAIVWFLLDEFHLANIAIHTAFRKKGIGMWFVSQLLEMAKNRNSKYATLEVRKSNIPAIRLYQKLGFNTVAERKNYYAAEKEDALIMERSLA